MDVGLDRLGEEEGLAEPARPSSVCTLQPKQIGEFVDANGFEAVIFISASNHAGGKKGFDGIVEMLRHRRLSHARFAGLNCRGDARVALDVGELFRVRRAAVPTDAPGLARDNAERADDEGGSRGCARLRQSLCGRPCPVPLPRPGAKTLGASRRRGR